MLFIPALNRAIFNSALLLSTVKLKNVEQALLYLQDRAYYFIIITILGRCVLISYMAVSVILF